MCSLKIVAGGHVYFQPNLMATRNSNDCSVRALCAACDMGWLEAFDSLVKIGRQIQDMPNGDKTLLTWMSQNGFVRHSIPISKGSKRPTVKQFAETHPEGTFVVRVAGHVVAVKEGQYWDCWDSGRKAVYSYWEKQ